jgi:hypothetical protein
MSGLDATENSTPFATRERRGRLAHIRRIDLATIVQRLDQELVLLR